MTDLTPPPPRAHRALASDTVSGRPTAPPDATSGLIVSTLHLTFPSFQSTTCPLVGWSGFDQERICNAGSRELKATLSFSSSHC